MRILVDIVHPAHVHFFRNAIYEWKADGHELLVTARDKDLTYELLHLYGIDFTPTGSAGVGLAGTAWELLRRFGLFWNLCRRFRPDVMLGIAGPGMAHVGWARGIPSLVFTDTENATLSNRITFPFATRILTPSCYEAEVPAKKHMTYDGYHELAYTHPDRFIPDPSILSAWDLQEDDDFLVVRFVSWGAMHDLKDHGFTDVLGLVEELQAFGRVLITSEAELPPELEPLRIQAAPHQIHHLLAFARLFIGESATMASESATLGTPAIFVSTSTRGYTNEEEHVYGLVRTFSDPETGQRDALRAAIELLADPETPARSAECRRRLLADKIDVTAFLLDLVKAYAPEREREPKPVPKPGSDR